MTAYFPPEAEQRLLHRSQPGEDVDHVSGRPLVYLTTLAFDEAWLAGLRDRVPGLEVHQVLARHAGEVPDELWARVEVLHSGSVFPAAGQAPRLRWVQLDTSGADHLEREDVWRRDVVITSLGGIAPVPMAEYVLMSVLALAHQLPALESLRRDRRWPRHEERLATLSPSPVRGRTLGVLGYGRIGREVARVAVALGMSVVALRRRPGPAARDAQEGVELLGADDLHELVRRSDVLVVVLPLTPSTRDLVDAEVLERLPAGASVVNVSRGGIVDETALLRLLRTGHLHGVALDVFAAEPLPPSSPWWDEPRAIVTPHVAGLAADYPERVRDLVVENLHRHARGEPLHNQVDRAAGY